MISHGESQPVLLSRKSTDMTSEAVSYAERFEIFSPVGLPYSFSHASHEVAHHHRGCGGPNLQG